MNHCRTWRNLAAGPTFIFPVARTEGSVRLSLVNYMEFAGQGRPSSSYQRSLWTENVGCIENRKATDVVLKASARWKRTGYAVCTDLFV